ncbi:ESF1 homolog [Athalia rosae]|uniref:ESF1 homolog n=1 Tax=Athalia rosae TaxID=37344 RepID=UPI0020348AB5|nr:ESF1 homolog [Athalia rosae]
MDNILEDSRFAHIAKDPRFRRIPKSERKVKIDKRFQSMFSDKKFTVKYSIDKRGRPSNQTSAENLKRYYELSSDDDPETNSEDDAVKSSNNKNKLKKQKNKKKTKEISLNHNDDAPEQSVEGKKQSKRNRSSLLGSGELLRIKSKVEGDSESDNEQEAKDTFDSEKESNSESDSELESENGDQLLKIDKSEAKIIDANIKKKLRDLSVDYARGEGELLTESSSEEESSDDYDDEDEIAHDWGELDKEAETTDEITNRLAACNLDWDRIRAVDLLVLFNSFVPSNGVIHSVTIYPSEFGLQRMKEEEVRGPIELVDSKNKIEAMENEDENEEGSKYHMEKLRQYQLNRLKYYYAVIVCDSPQTANKIYTECDGIEYESTATKLDLRFIPDDTTFDQEPREVCDKIPELSKYQPRQFTTTALQQVKVELTWDETNPQRQEVAEKISSGKIDDVDPSDIQAYLASGSSNEEDESESNAEHGDSESGDDQDPIGKYKSLLRGIEEQQEEKKKKGIEMEITWGLGSKLKSEKLVADKLKNDEALTPFEQYLEKRRAKKKAKKAEREKPKNEEGSDLESDSGDSIPSDVDMNDPYFAEEFKNRKPKSKKKTSKDQTTEVSADQEQQNAELELLLMDKTEDEGRNHFDMKKIEDNESLSKSKKKRQNKLKKHSTKEEIIDDFEVNVNDKRFGALFSSHHFNIDPADSHYRKTKGTEALVKEKLKRRADGDLKQETEKKVKPDQKLNAELSALVKSVKRKTQNISQRIK